MELLTEAGEGRPDLSPAPVEEGCAWEAEVQVQASGCL